MAAVLIGFEMAKGSDNSKAIGEGMWGFKCPLSDESGIGGVIEEDEGYLPRRGQFHRSCLDSLRNGIEVGTAPNYTLGSMREGSQ